MCVCVCVRVRVRACVHVLACVRVVCVLFMFMLLCRRYTSGEGRPVICSIFCLHYEAKTLDECDLTIAINGYCQCNEVVGITCSK